MHQDAPPPPPAGRPTIEFRSAYDQGFARVAAVTLPVALADPAANAAVIRPAVCPTTACAWPPSPNSV